MEVEKKGYAYKKSDGNAAVKGHFYEIKVIMLIAIQAIIKGFTFKLASNMENAGTFDDVVVNFEYIDESGVKNQKCVFIQLKHIISTERDKLSLKELNQRKKKPGRFELQKYFNSYLAIQKDQSMFLENGFDVTNAEFIIYTNAHILEEDAEYFKVANLNNITEILKSNDNDVFKIKGSVIESFLKNLVGVEEDIRLFLKQLTFFVCQEKELGVERRINNIIMERYDEHNECDINDNFSSSYERYKHWWMEVGVVNYLTNLDDHYSKYAAKFVSQNTKDVQNKLQDNVTSNGIEFSENYISEYMKVIKEHSWIEIMSVSGATLLSVAKLLQGLKAIQVKQLMCVDSELLKSNSEKILCNFKSSEVMNYLILILEDY